jgi:hypothetical protein
VFEQWKHVHEELNMVMGEYGHVSSQHSCQISMIVVFVYNHGKLPGWM